MAPKLELAFTMRGYMDKENSHDLKAMKAGPTRIMVPMNRGFIKGSGLDAKLTPGSGDWILVRTCQTSWEQRYAFTNLCFLSAGHFTQRCAFGCASPGPCPRW